MPSSAPAPVPAPAAPARARSASRVAAPWLRAVRANPGELLLQPLLLAVLLLAAGFAATGIAAERAATTERRSLQSVADGAAAALEFALLYALAPLDEVRDTLENDSALAVHSAARHYFAGLAPGLVSSNKAIACLQLWPYGRLAAAVPLAGGSAADGTRLDLGAALGADMFDSGASPDARSAALLALSARELVLLGPLADVFSCSGGAAGLPCSPAPALVAHLPVFVLTANATDPWADSAWPAAGGPGGGGGGGGASVGPFTGATNCSGVHSSASGGISLCATDALGDGRRLWGFVSAVISWPQLLDLARVTELGDEFGQSWTVSRLPDEFDGGTGGAEPLLAAAFAAAGNGAALPSAPFATGVVAEVGVFSA